MVWYPALSNYIYFNSCSFVATCPERESKPLLDIDSYTLTQYFSVLTICMHNIALKTRGLQCMLFHPCLYCRQWITRSQLFSFLHQRAIEIILNCFQNGKTIWLIPSLKGRIFKFDGNSVEVSMRYQYSNFHKVLLKYFNWRCRLIWYYK